MAPGVVAPADPSSSEAIRPNPGIREILLVLASALFFCAVSRWPLRRLAPFDFDEFYYLQVIREYRFPMTHTLFLASARLVGTVVRDPYAAFVVLSIGLSALALTGVWWWLRALTRPTVALAAAFTLGVAPLFWAYGGLAASYTAIILVGSVLLGIAVRAWQAPSRWYPPCAAVLLAIGTGYRVDIGIFWTPVFLAILTRYRVPVAVGALVLVGALNVAWFALMLYDVGGWQRYRASTAAFAHSAGYMNSVLHLGIIDGPVRYAAKIGVALLWTLGLGLLAAPRGAARLFRSGDGAALAGLLALSVAPALALHLLLHFGVPGYCFHYVPALIALVALGVGRSVQGENAAANDRAPLRLAALGASFAALFLLYPTNYDRPGLWGDFDRAFAHQTRVGLRLPSQPDQRPRAWRTAASRSVGHGLQAARDPQLPAEAR